MLLEVGGDEDRIDLAERQPLMLTPAEKGRDGSRIRQPGVPVADVRGEEFEKPPRCPLPSVGVMMAGRVSKPAPASFRQVRPRAFDFFQLAQDLPAEAADRAFLSRLLGVRAELAEELPPREGDRHTERERPVREPQIQVRGREHRASSRAMKPRSASASLASMS